MQKFYLTYPIWNAARTELNWTHYRSLIRIESEQSRDWYTTECLVNPWSSRALERQISTLYYERLLSSKDLQPVRKEASEKTIALPSDMKKYLRKKHFFNRLLSIT